MPVQRFRDLDEARRALWANADDAPGRARRLWRLFARLVGGSMPRGIRKFGSIEEANRDRDQWIDRRVQMLRAQRTGSSPGPVNETTT